MNDINTLPDDGRALTFGQHILYSVGSLSTDFINIVILQWLMYFYAPTKESGLPVYMPIIWIGIIKFSGRIVDSVADPLIGFWSDRTKSKRGRRIPFIIFFTPLLALSFALIWFPPVEGKSTLNALWLLAWISIFWFAFTAVIAPYLSLHPEITPYRKERMTLSAWMSVFMLIGTISASIGAGVLIGNFKNGINVGGFFIRDGFKLVGIIGAILIIVSFYITAISIKERPHHEAKEVPFGFFKSILLCFKNPAFIPYIVAIALLSLAKDIIIISLPYMTSIILWTNPNADVIFFKGMSSELVAGILTGVLVIVAVALFPVISIAGARYGKKRVFTWALVSFAVICPFFATLGKWPWIPPPFQGLILMLMLAPAASALFVLNRPLIADVMDYDEKLTGFRREAMYNGAEGLCTKFATGMSNMTLAALFTFLGNSGDHPLGVILSGPTATIFLIIAIIAFLKYPLND